MSNINNQNNKPLYIQAFKNNIKEFFKIKDMFPKLSVEKISEIYNIINKSNKKGQLNLNITMKDPSKKQVIIPIRINNMKSIMVQLNTHIANINRLLKNIKSNFLVNFIQSNNKGIIVTTNNVAATSDLNVIEKYMKDLDDIDPSNIMSPRLSNQSST